MTLVALVLTVIATPAASETRASDSGQPMILDFHAEWCPPCQRMRPAIDQLTRKGYPVRSIDVDESPELAERYDVSSVPTFVIIDAEGRSVARTKGYQPASQLAELYRTTQLELASAAKGRDAQDASDERISAATNDDTSETPDRTFKNPKPWETVVRIRVLGNGAIGFGSGTVIHSTSQESLILTCAHIFKLEGQRRQPHPSQYPRKVKVDLFDGRLHGTRPAQVHFVETVDAQVIDYNFQSDVGLVRIRPGRKLPASRVVPPDWTPQRGAHMVTAGCSEGNDATIWGTKIDRVHERMSLNGGYDGIRCTFAPKQGRSGGGLYTAEGYVAGVCNFAELQSPYGLYAHPRSIHRMLDRHNLMALYLPPDRAQPDRLLAQQDEGRRRQGASDSRSRTITRAQSPEEPGDAKSVTIPPPELLGIQAPEVAAAASNRDPSGSSAARSSPWQPIAAPSGEHNTTIDPASRLADRRDDDRRDVETYVSHLPHSDDHAPSARTRAANIQRVPSPRDIADDAFDAALDDAGFDDILPPTRPPGSAGAWRAVSSN